jgi:hypothetical protein
MKNLTEEYRGLVYMTRTELQGGAVKRIGASQNGKVFREPAVESLDSPGWAIIYMVEEKYQVVTSRDWILVLTGPPHDGGGGD